MSNLCFVIPVYNHTPGICNTIERLARYQRTCIIVDDGSDAECCSAIVALGEKYDWLQVIHRDLNGGKGAAVKSGLSLAEKLGFSHALQLDADEQHDLSCIADFIRKSSAHPQATILGVPLFDDSVPRARQFSRYLTHIWVWINTLSFAIQDSMCGFRIYPIKPTLRLCNNAKLGDRMDFDIEILVRLYWDDMKFIGLPVATQYPADGISHFRLWQDNWLITKMHTRLFLGMLQRSPKLAKRALGA